MKSMNEMNQGELYRKIKDGLVEQNGPGVIRDPDADAAALALTSQILSVSRTSPGNMPENCQRAVAD